MEVKKSQMMEDEFANGWFKNGGMKQQPMTVKGAHGQIMMLLDEEDLNDISMIKHQQLDDTQDMILLRNKLQDLDQNKQPLFLDNTLFEGEDDLQKEEEYQEHMNTLWTNCQQLMEEMAREKEQKIQTIVEEVTQEKFEKLAEIKASYDFLIKKLESMKQREKEE